MSTNAARHLPPGVRLDNLRPVSDAHERVIIDLYRLNHPPGIWSPEFQWPTYEAYVERERHVMLRKVGAFTHTPLAARLRELGLDAQS